MTSEINQFGWIVLDIPEWAERKAIKIRQERDKKYGNIYPEQNTDERWVGDLGEIVFKSFLTDRNIDKAKYKWILEDAAGQADFIMMDGSKVDVKTVKRRVPVRPDYTAQITAQHIEENVEHYFFMSYQNDRRKMTLIGGISKAEFQEHAIYYGEGAQVHENYTIRAGHEIYNIDVRKLISPDVWLEQFTQ